MTVSAKVRALRERWRSDEGRALVVEVVRWLGGSGLRPPRGIGEFNGRVDLRGLMFPDARHVGSFKVGESTFESIDGFPRFTCVSWGGVDFSGAVIRNARIVDSRIDGCLFDGADLFDWRLRNTKTSDSSFARADMQSSAIGTGDQGGLNEWTRVNFDRADLRGAVVSECVFRACTFRKAKLKGVDFINVTLDGAEFEGMLDNVLFEVRRFDAMRDPGPMRNVDFRGVLFRNCDFRGYHFENVQFDSAPGLRVIRNFPQVVQRALQIANASSDQSERDVIWLLEHSQGLLPEGDTIFVGADYAPRLDYADALDRLYGQAQRDLRLAT